MHNQKLQAVCTKQFRVLNSRRLFHYPWNFASAMIGLSLLREKTWWWECKPMDMCPIEGHWGYYFAYQKLLQTRAQDASSIFVDFLRVKIGFDDGWIADLKSQRCWWNCVFCGNHNRIIQSQFFFSDFFRMWPSKKTKTNLNTPSLVFFCIKQVHETGSTNDTKTHHWLFEIWLLYIFWLVGDLMCHCPNCPPLFSFYYTGVLTIAFWRPSEVWFLQHIVCLEYGYPWLQNQGLGTCSTFGGAIVPGGPRKLVQIIRFVYINLLILFWECKVNSQFFTQLRLIVTWITATLGKTCVFLDEFPQVMKNLDEYSDDIVLKVAVIVVLWGLVDAELEDLKFSDLVCNPGFLNISNSTKIFLVLVQQEKNMLWAWFALFSSVGVNTLFYLAQFLIDQTIWITGQVENATGSAILWNGRVLYTTDMKASVAAECRAV